ncbi:MAG: ABC transporter permease [Gammaproteobacteria bacterium]|nr:ABC transporter permease [Gammaproteobacteria bacterium]
MQRLVNILQLGMKEMRSLWFDKVLLIFLIWSFSFGLYESAQSQSTELRNASVAVVDEDRSPLSLRLLNALRPPEFMPPKLISISELDHGLDAGLYTFALHVPAGFQRDVLAGHQPATQLNIDATRMNEAFIGAGYIHNILTDEVTRFVQGYRGDPPLPIRLTTRMQFNPNLNGVWFFSAMELVNNITFLSIILAGAALIREREHGTIEHLLVMPLTPFQIMAAKVWANGLVVLVVAALSLWIVVQGALAMPVAGSISLFLFAAMLHLFSTTALGILLATIARSMPQFALLMILVVVPLNMLSGASAPTESMPLAVQGVMLAAPTTHFVSLAQAILFRGAGLAVVWPQLLAIAGIGAAFFAAALLRFRKTVTLAQG